jgi:excisionase family DNA binding protein
MMLPPDWIKEKLLKPAGLPEDLLNELTPDLMAGVRGELPLYDKSRVENLIDQHRPGCMGTKSFVKEDFNMVDFGSEDQPLERIASCLEKLAGVLVPRAETPQPAAVEMLTPAEAAKQMRLNVQTVREWCRGGKMGVRTGNKWLISQGEVKEYLRGRLLVTGRAS